MLEDRATEIARSDRGLEDMCFAFDELLRRDLDYAVAAWATHDPATGLFTSCTLSGIPKDVQREAQVFRHEFNDGEPATLPSLISSGGTVTVLSEVTGGDLMSAARYREVFAPFGVSDELRAVLWSEGQPWGSLSVYRQDGTTFDEEEAERVGRLAPVFGDGLRLTLLRQAATTPEAVDEPPGILQVRPDGSVDPLTDPADRWLDLAGGRLVTTANATAAAVRNRRDWDGATARLALDDGSVLVLNASSTTADDGTVAVIVDRARRAQIGSMLVDAYGLTPRQREVLGLLLLGRSMIEIARSLDISEHTANDHRKAIYRRIGVSSRSELAALLQSEHYEPRSHRGVPPSPYGGFLE